MENGNGNSRNQNEPMQVEDIELKESPLKRQLTPPIDMDSQPPAKRSVPEGEVEGEVTMIDEASEEEGVDGEAGEVGEDGETGEDGEAGEAEQPASMEVTETGELLPNNMPKIYDLFATCVSYKFHSLAIVDCE